MDEVKLSLCSMLERVQNLINMMRLKLCIMLLTISGRVAVELVPLPWDLGGTDSVNIAD